MSTPSAIVAQIRQEAALFDSKDRLLNFTVKNDFQSPLIMEAGDLFYEKWHQSGAPLSLETFFNESPNFTAQQKIKAIDSITATLRQKNEDFHYSDLYLIVGFLKWDGNALAPSLLIPLDFDISKGTLSLSNRLPIENVILRERLKDTVHLPKAEDAVVNGSFSLLMYFSLFEKAIAAERNWKFTRHGLCLGFFDTENLLLKKRMEQGYSDKQIDNHPVLSLLLREEGFQIQESLFENADFNQVFCPADHHFLYPTDSHTNKVTVDAENENASAYAIQALPGTDKMKVVANIVADSIANQKNVLVVYRRAVTESSFQDSWNPPFRTFPKVDHTALEQTLRTSRKEILDYYDSINKPIAPSGVMLAEALTEFALVKTGKQKIPDTIFQGLLNLDYSNYKELKEDLFQVCSLYFDQGGIDARKAFLGVKVPSLGKEQQDKLSKELNNAANIAKSLDDIIARMTSAGLFPTGIFLSSLVDILELMRDYFDENTPVFEDWQLRNNNWETYKSSLIELPEAGDKWVRYRRQTSDIYTDNAVNEAIQGARDDFAECQSTKLKGLSDRYRSSRRKLLSVLRNPKEVDSDAKLLDLIDTLLELQDNKKAYTESAILGNMLLGKDWLYEKSNWIELNKKIQFIYNFRDTHKKDPKQDLLLQILEQWHLFKDIQPEIRHLCNSVNDLLQAIRQINKDMALETPLESLSIEKWLDRIKLWSENWKRLDIHLQLTSLFNKMQKYNCPNLLNYVEDTDNVQRDIEGAVAHYWAGAQIHLATKNNPTLFSITPKVKSQKSKEYQKTLDAFSSANFRELHDTIEQYPEKLTICHINDSFRVSENCSFDLCIMLDADSISMAAAIPSIYAAKRAIFVGNPQNPAIERQIYDAYTPTAISHTVFFQESILNAALRQGVPTRELWFSTQYADCSLVAFANNRIYNHGIKQLPVPSRAPFKGIKLKVVSDKVLAIAKAAIAHAEKQPGKTLGIVAFHHSTCLEIDDSIRAMLPANSPAANFFNIPNDNVRYYVKTPERAIDRFRDVVMVCAETEGVNGSSGDHKLSVCTTLAKTELQVYIADTDMSKQGASKHSLFWDWISYLKSKDYSETIDTRPADSPIRDEVIKILRNEGIQIEESYSKGGIPVGPVIVDNNNKNRFLGLIEDDCTTERFRDSVEDRDYIRPRILRQQGWKVLNLWLPFWFVAKQDEIGHLLATIAIEQSIAPPPVEEAEAEDNQDDVFESSAPATVPYTVLHPKIEGTPHDKPIAELPAAALIMQLKFYVDHEAPIHEDILKNRILELHHVDRAGPILQKVLTDAITQGLQKKRFIKTGPFFYSLKPQNLEPRNRSNRPDYERRLSYVAPEERALLPASMDEHALNQAMGLLD